MSRKQFLQCILGPLARIDFPMVNIAAELCNQDRFAGGDFRQARGQTSDPFPFAMRIESMSQQKEIISTINSLIETLKDGQEGFRQASEAVKDAQLKMLFNEYSLQRSRFAGELQGEAIRLGEPSPEKSSSTAGAMHRAWINLKSAVTSKDDHAILEECERGEDSAVNEYKKAMEEEELSAPIRETISRQYADVKRAHDRIRTLRDARDNN